MMLSIVKLTPCGNGWSVEEQIEIDALFSDLDSCNDESRSDPDGSKDDNPEDKLERPQIVMPTGEDEEEYTLCAFGDISLSNIHFVPGPPEALSPESVIIRSGPITKRPVVIRKIPPSPSKAFVFDDLETIINSQVTSRKPIVDHVYSPQPQRLINLQSFGIDSAGSRLNDIDELIRCATPTGSLRENRKHPRWECDRGGYHLGLRGSMLKLT